MSEAAQEIGVTSPYAHLRQYVVSRSMTGSPDPAVEVISADPLAKVRELKREDGTFRSGAFGHLGGALR